MDALVIFGIVVVVFFLGVGAGLALVGKPTVASRRAILRDESTMSYLHWH